MTSATGFSEPKQNAAGGHAGTGKPNAAHHKPTYDSVEALAADLGMSRHTTYAALRRGDIPHIRIGKRFVIPKSAVQEWLRTAGTLPTAS
jgi:excisionase family DNA binding protein